MATTKDSYWFRHDSNASRDLKLMKIRVIYDFWGIGVYWTIIEFLREQPDYKYEYSELNLQLLCELIGCKDLIKFNNFINDCIKINLFSIDNNYLLSYSLIDRMIKWESCKNNGEKPKRSQTEAKNEPNGNIRIDNIIEDNNKNIFEIFRLKYPGTKRGLETEFNNFVKKHKDSKNIIPLLYPALINQINLRIQQKEKNEFTPEWKNLQTWINQRCWEEIHELKQPIKANTVELSIQKQRFDKVDIERVSLLLKEGSEEQQKSYFEKNPEHLEIKKQIESSGK